MGVRDMKVRNRVVRKALKSLVVVDGAFCVDLYIEELSFNFNCLTGTLIPNLFAKLFRFGNQAPLDQKNHMKRLVLLNLEV